MTLKSKKPVPQVGEVYREIYRSRGVTTFLNRTIRIVEVFHGVPGSVLAYVATGADGKPPEKPRNTKMMFRTLRVSYRLEKADQRRALTGDMK